MLDAAQQGDLEVTAIQIVNRSIVELLTEDEAGAPRQEVGIALRNGQSRRSLVILALNMEICQL